ncbi:ribbon-helix-helix domain-containing protein [Ruminococcus sp. Marseille-P6503]|uniref:ribbon-helix-helix domain-containing protein n=1 Tax=Ruminococcus sp. Marseille-P6503 TaxID=2364796 RepID=UPI000F53D329|nr:ribbon-helix-helix domain-containing protein [Ruminococcus sp. Marseille-P6503]
MDKTQRYTVRVPADMAGRLEQKAAAEHITVSDLVRRYIDKGLNMEGYKTEIDFLTEIMQTVLSGILEPQVERIIKLIIKLGKITGGSYYLQLANLLNEDNKSDIGDISEIVNRCNRLAIKYMSQKDSDVERFLLNNTELLKEALRLKDNPYGFDFNAIGGSDE